MTERVEWDELPAELRDAVEARTGPVIGTETVTSGFNCSVALKVRTREDDTLFLKGVRTSDTVAVAGLRCEERVNSLVGGISPSIRHGFEAAGWRCLAFAHVDGRHVDYGPGTGDLEALARTARRMHQVRTPAFSLPQLADGFAGHLRPGEADALHGTHLLHTDTNPHNVLIDRAGDAYVVDWAMPALGPVWVDAVYLAVWLMAYGQPPEDAVAWLNGFDVWRQADRRAVETFVDVTCRHWTDRAGEKDAEPRNADFRRLLEGAR
ncbi:phosphotransferase family protein [Streptomyces sp. NPDC059578]|uniref:phosphotransferase family protein n=1 Tax=Streptomyces sp. NPDC059578 TaxID=3346874 RepID=UPI0036952B7B